jgi:hypothetical protein
MTSNGSVPEVITVAKALELVAERLDAVSRDLHTAYTALESAEEKWEEHWDNAAEDLQEELREGGSTRSPSEHAILSRARKDHREDYHAWRRAKRSVERAEKVSSNRRAQLSAYQTLFKNFGAEAEVQDYVSQR